MVKEPFVMATTKPRRIGVDPVLVDGHTEVWAGLQAAGHTVELHEMPYDVYFGPRAWYMQPEMLQYVAVAVKNAQKRMDRKPAKRAKKVRD